MEGLYSRPFVRVSPTLFILGVKSPTWRRRQRPLLDPRYPERCWPVLRRGASAVRHEHCSASSVANGRRSYRAAAVAGEAYTHDRRRSWEGRAQRHDVAGRT